MNSGNQLRRIVTITSVAIIFLSSCLIQFGGNADAAPRSLPRFFENPTGTPQKVEEQKVDEQIADEHIADEQIVAETGYVYLPLTMSKNFSLPYFGGEATQLLIEGKKLYSRTDDLNIGWTRLNKHVGISWRKLQKNPGDEINWDLLVDFENQLRSLRKAGITPVVSLNDSPLWAVDSQARSDGNPTSCGPIHPDYFDEYGEFLRKIVNRYKAPEFNVHNWEIGNEPDVDPDLTHINSIFGCWGDIDDKLYYGGKKYGELLNYISPIIKSEDYIANVWIGGLLLATPNTTDKKLGKPERFLRGILEAGAGPNFDVVAYHGHSLYYGEIVDSDTQLSGPWIELGGGAVGKARYLRQILAEYNVNKPLVLGESGIGCRKDFSFCVPTPDATFYQFQADMLVRVAVRVASDDIKGFSWYKINRGNNWRNQSLLNASVNPRPAYFAYQQLTLQLHDAKYLNPANYGNDVEAYAFKQGRNKIHVIWTKEDKSIDILIPISKFIDAFDRDGNQISNPPIVGTNYKFTTEFSPIYIIRKP